MAKSNKAQSYEKEDWEAHDGMHTLMRAAEIVKDKALLKRVKKKAAEHAQKSRDVAERASSLAKTGAISEKAMAKVKNKGQGGNVKDLEKTTPLAKGTEGDKPSSRMMIGAAY
jgi:hypothetical protein